MPCMRRRCAAILYRRGVDMRVGKTGLFFLFLIVPFSFLSGIGSAQDRVNSTLEMDRISELIFMNECSGKDSLLITWNEGENFPSLGIGHFIWYPDGKEGPFKESFPQLLSFFEQKGIELPAWFKSLPGRHAPWSKRKVFLKDLQQGRLELLRDFLIKTKSVQAEFLVERLKRAIPQMMVTLPDESKLGISQKIVWMLRDGRGLYPLVDYVNFNGEGTLYTERYHGQGWGLLQVLEEMQTPEADGRGDAVLEFARAAEVILNRRVDHSPWWRNEKRWLSGWKARIHTYVNEGKSGALRVDYSLRDAILKFSIEPEHKLEDVVVSPVEMMA